MSAAVTIDTRPHAWNSGTVDRTRAFRSARRHSRWVRLLRVALPMGVVVVILVGPMAMVVIVRVIVMVFRPRGVGIGTFDRRHLYLWGRAAAKGSRNPMIQSPGRFVNSSPALNLRQPAACSRCWRTSSARPNASPSAARPTAVAAKTR